MKEPWMTHDEVLDREAELRFAGWERFASFVAGLAAIVVAWLVWR
jgi:hypothetical protein